MSLAGTPLYLAPELFRGQPATPASDIYSLGVLIYHLVTGTYPVTGATRAEIERAHDQGRHTRLRDIRPSLPQWLIGVIERAIARAPGDRYQTAGELGDALAGPTTPERLGSPTSQRTSGSAEPPAPPLWTTSQRWIVAGSGAITLVAAAIGVRLWLLPADASRTVNAADPASVASAPAPANSYSVRATFHKADREADVPLAPGDAVEPGDRLSVDIETSKQAHIYVLNRDDRGESFLLFPMPGFDFKNPLPGGRHRLPGTLEGKEQYWQVTSAGGRERFVVYVSPTRLEQLETFLKSLPVPKVGQRVATSAALPPSLVGRLRGVGGLVETPARQASSPSPLEDLARPLTTAEETASGVWVRQMILSNPRR